MWNTGSGSSEEWQKESGSYAASSIIVCMAAVVSTAVRVTRLVVVGVLVAGIQFGEWLSQNGGTSARSNNAGIEVISGSGV